MQKNPSKQLLSHLLFLSAGLPLDMPSFASADQARGQLLGLLGGSVRNAQPVATSGKLMREKVLAQH